MGRFTSLLCLDLQHIRWGSVPYRREPQHTQAVRNIRSQAWYGGETAVVRVVLLPSTERGVQIWCVVDAIASDLSVRFLWRFPLHQHGACAQHTCLDMQRRRWRRLLSCPGFDGVTGRSATDVVDGHDAELVFRIGAETTDAIPRGCNTVHLLEVGVRRFGPVLNNVVGHRLWVSRVPCKCNTCSCRFRHN